MTTDKKTDQEKYQDKYYKLMEKIESTNSVYLIIDPHDCRVAGTILCRYTKSTMGYTAHLGFCMYYYEEKDPIFGYAKAGGYGYDKFDHCCRAIFKNEEIKQKLKELWNVRPLGDHSNLTWKMAFEDAGFTVIQAI